MSWCYVIESGVMLMWQMAERKLLFRDLGFVLAFKIGESKRG